MVLIPWWDAIDKQLPWPTSNDVDYVLHVGWVDSDGRHRHHSMPIPEGPENFVSALRQVADMVEASSVPADRWQAQNRGPFLSLMCKARSLLDDAQEPVRKCHENEYRSSEWLRHCENWIRAVDQFDTDCRPAERQKEPEPETTEGEPDQSVKFHCTKCGKYIKPLSPMFQAKDGGVRHALCPVE